MRELVLKSKLSSINYKHLKAHITLGECAQPQVFFKGEVFPLDVKQSLIRYFAFTISNINVETSFLYKYHDWYDFFVFHFVYF